MEKKGVESERGVLGKRKGKWGEERNMLLSCRKFRKKKPSGATLLYRKQESWGTT